MRPTLGIRGSLDEETLVFARQIGAEGVATLPEPRRPELGYYEVPELVAARERVESFGLRFEAFSMPPWRMSYKWMLGLPGRDGQIEKVQKTIRNMGAAGISVMIYNMHAMRLYRTSRNVRSRGGATATSFDMAAVKDAPLMTGGPDVDTTLIPKAHRRPITDDDMWRNLEYFLKAVVPVAEEADVKLALHPDDPPVPSIGGVARIMRSPEAFRRAIEMVPSPNNGLKFCVGCFSEMGADVAAELRYFGSRGKIFFVDFRNVKGSADRFTEAFPDDGKEDMFALIRALADVGYDGPVSPDHSLHIAGDTEWGHQYWAYAIGHMRALIQAAKPGG
jgi:mannonate dehydratase